MSKGEVQEAALYLLLFCRRGVVLDRWRRFANNLDEIHLVGRWGDLEDAVCTARCGLGGVVRNG